MSNLKRSAFLVLWAMGITMAGAPGCGGGDGGAGSDLATAGSDGGGGDSGSGGSAVTYKFIETATGKTLGVMNVKASVALANGWTTTSGLVSILEGGLAGLTFAFPDQGAPNLSVGTSGDLPAFQGMAYGSSDGKTLDVGGASGGIDGFPNGNKLAVLTFTPAGFGGNSIGSSATTAYNNAMPGTGIVQTGSGGHNDKYIYKGIWTRQ